MYILPFLSVFNSVLPGIGEMYQSFYGSDFYLLHFQFSAFTFLLKALHFILIFIMISFFILSMF